MADGVRDSDSARCRTAAWLLAGLGDAGRAAARRAAATGRFASLRRRQDDGVPRPAVAPRAALAPPHPSWHVEALRALPLGVARLYVDRLPLAESRAVLRELRPAEAEALAAAGPLPASPVAEALIGLRSPAPFPEPPAWARPAGPPDVVLRRLAAEPWPFAARLRDGEALEERAAAAARDPESTWPGPEAARGAARLGLALQERPDEAWGVAGAWPVELGRALLRAWNAWPDLLDPGSADVAAAAHRHVTERWREWLA